MNLSHTLLQKGVIVTLLLFATSICSVAQGTEDEQQTNDENGIFAAVSLIGGFAQKSGLNGNLEVNDNYDDFLSLNIELKAQWNGFFVEFPGRSQEKVDGQFSGNSFGYNLYNTEDWSYDLYVVRSSGGTLHKFNSPEETLEIQRDSNVRLGVRATGYFEDLFAQFILTPHSFEEEIGGIEASASIRQTWLYRNWNFYNSIGLRYRSSDINDFYFGVDQTLSDRLVHLVRDDPNFDNLQNYFAPYEAKAGISVHGEVGFEYPISESMVFGGFFQYVFASDAAHDSPLFVGDKVGNAFGLSLTYVF